MAENRRAAFHLPGALTRCRAVMSSGTRIMQALAYIYSRGTEVDARQAKVLTKDEARRIAINVARLPELLGKGERLAKIPPLT